MKLNVTDQKGAEHVIDATEGDKVMEIVCDAGLPMKAECEGCCACGTCHIYVDEDWFDRLAPADEDEVDMLDLAFDVADNSRLSCQIRFTPELDGMRVTLAPGTE